MATQPLTSLALLLLLLLLVSLAASAPDKAPGNPHHYRHHHYHHRSPRDYSTSLASSLMASTVIGSDLPRTDDMPSEMEFFHDQTNRVRETTAMEEHSFLRMMVDSMPPEGSLMPNVFGPAAMPPATPSIADIPASAPEPAIDDSMAPSPTDEESMDSTISEITSKPAGQVSGALAARMSSTAGALVAVAAASFFLL